MPTTAIVDVDGTLVDTNYHHAIAWFRAFKANGIVLPIWQVHRHIGMGGDHLVPALTGNEVAERLGNDIREAEKKLYQELIDETEPFDGAEELLRELKRRGHKVVMASSSQQEHVDHYLDVLGARDVLDGWTTSADVEATKPEPDLVGAALSKVDAQDGVMLGDSVWDVKAAAKLGVTTLAMLTGGFSEHELIEAGAAAVFASIRDLLAALGDTPLA